MSYEPIFTDKAYAVMKKQHISRQEVLTAFYSKNLESVSIPGATQGIAHLPGKTVGCIYKKNQRGQWIIITCWSRKRL
jgi:hypothetical protein